MPNQTSLDKFFKLGLGLVAWFTLCWMLLHVAQYLEEIVILLGFVLLLTYILLGPVNLMELSTQRLIHATLTLTKMRFLESRIPSLLPRALAILLVYLAFGLIMLIVSVRFMPVAVEQLNQFVRQLPRYTQHAEDWVLNQQAAQTYLHQEVITLKTKGQLPPPQAQRIEQETQITDSTVPVDKLSPTEKQVVREKVFGTTEHINDFVKDHIGGTLNNLIKVISTTVAGFIYTLTGLVLVFYFLLDGHYLKEGFLQMLPKGTRSSAQYLLNNMHSVMFGFVKGQVMLGVATGVYMIIVYSVFDVPFAFFLGTFFAISEILPVVGTWLGFLPGIIVLLFMNPVKLIMVMGLVYVYQLIKDNMVAPRVLGKVMGLHPVIVIISLLICARVAGVIGILFAIPLASMVNVIIRYLQQKESGEVSI